MIITIINNDGTSKVLSYEQNSTFVQQCQKDNNHLLSMVMSVAPNYKTFTTKEVVGGEVIKNHISVAEKLPKKMRVKNSFQTSKDIFMQFATKSKLRDMFNGSCSSIKLSTQFGTLVAD